MRTFFRNFFGCFHIVLIEKVGIDLNTFSEAKKLR